MVLEFPIVFGVLSGSNNGYHLYVNVSLGAMGCQRGESAGEEGIDELNDQTARRGAEAPLQVSVACSFLFLGGLLLFLATGLFCVFELPPTGVKSKRIFLSADAASTAAR
ncbi:MAG: hypothetical protein ABWY06_01815 [Pseudomonas sp.]|uniref:hypothetical protein n=1 Tax=Pseudomonas sp. TaxID=306 RepID=UPI003396F46E